MIEHRVCSVFFETQELDGVLNSCIVDFNICYSWHIFCFVPERRSSVSRRKSLTFSRSSFSKRRQSVDVEGKIFFVLTTAASSFDFEDARENKTQYSVRIV